MLRAQHWAARGYDLSKKRLCSTRTVRAPVPPLSARVAGRGCLLGLRHGACPGAVLNTLQAIALDATRRLHPLALSSIVSTLALLGVSTLRATHSASSHWSAVGEIAAAMHAPSTASAHPSAPSRTFAERPGLRHKLITRVISDDQDSPEFYYTRNTF